MPSDRAGASLEREASTRRGLLFRLSASERPEQPLDVVESIVQNLRAILNSDLGISPSAPGLGLSLHRCLQDWDTDQPAVLAAIEEQIARFEPRLAEVEVDEAPQNHTARFSVLITAKLDDGRTFRARTDMTASGAAEVAQIVTQV